MAAAPLSAGIEKPFIDGLPLMHLGVCRSFWRDGTLMSKVRVAVVTQTGSIRALVGLWRQRQHVLMMVAVHQVVGVSGVTSGGVGAAMASRVVCACCRHAVGAI